MGTHPLRADTSQDLAKKEIADKIAEGARLRQDARRVADKFHDPQLGRTAREIMANSSVDEWVDKKSRWVGLTVNALRDIFAISEPAETFNNVSTSHAAQSKLDRQQTLAGEMVAIDAGLDHLRRLGEQFESVTRDSDAKQDVAMPAQKPSVFVVHGRDETIKHQVARALEMTGQHPVVILDEVPDRGRTIIEKFEEEASAAAYAVILVTGDDVGRLRKDSVEQPRARQNVLFELGWFAGRLGRKYLTLLCEEGVELPSDYRGVAYIVIDEHGKWKHRLIRDLHDAGLAFDSNKLSN
jgi:predicted nucleotide-binding protein